MLQDAMLHKRGLAMKYVAGALMPLEPGDKLPTITQFCETSGASRGNIQMALDTIRSVGGAAFLPRGHLGTFLTEIDYLRLAEICGIDSLVGAMPLPYSRRYEGLATGIYASINQKNLTGHIAFSRGSETRLNLLERNHYDFVVMSALALAEYRQAGHNLVAVMDFGPGTYVERHAVIVRPDFNGQWQGCRVAIDNSSLDQQRLTMDYFSTRPVELVAMPYNQILPNLLNGSIDAGVWNLDDVSMISQETRFLDLELPTIAGADTAAVIVCRASDGITQRLLSQVLDLEHIARTQAQVMSGELIPYY